MSAAASRAQARAENRVSTLLWLAWRTLPPLDQADQQMLIRVSVSCGYLAVPLTVGLAAPRLPEVTLVSLLCLAVPGLPVCWWGAVPLGARRRETALALRQARIDARAAGLGSISRVVTYPAVGAFAGSALITALHRPLAAVLPTAAPLTAALHASPAAWLLAAPGAILLLIAFTAVLGCELSARFQAALSRLARRLDHREAAPQPQ